MSCITCKKEVTEIKIASPDDLKLAFKRAVDLMKSGLLKFEGTALYCEPFADIVAGKYWGDIVSIFFSCGSCGQGFQIRAETFHGSGGAFEGVDEIPKELQGDMFP